MARPAPPIEHVIRAFELVRDGEGLAGAREKLREEGITAGLETVRRWALIGAKASSWLQENSKEEDYTGPEFVRQKFTAFLDNLAARGLAELDKGDGQYKDIAPILLNLAKEQARALGGYAALKVQHEGLAFGELDPATQAAVKAMEAQAAAREQQLLSGNEDS